MPPLSQFSCIGSDSGSNSHRRASELFVQGTRTAGVAEGGVDQRAEEGFEHGTVISETFCLTKVDTGRCVRRDRRVLAARTTLSLWAPRARVGCPVESCSGSRRSSYGRR